METPLTLYTASPISLLSIVSPSKYPSLLHRVFPSPFFPFSSLPFFPRICLPNDLYRHSTRMSHIRNSSPPPLHPDVSHPEFFSVATLPRCLTSGILPHQRSTLSGCLTSGILPCQRSTLSGCLTSEILLRRHSTRMSHTRNSAPPTFNIPPRYLTSGILPGQRSTFSGYLTSGILSDRHSTFSRYLTSGILSDQRSTFFFILRAFS